MSIEEKVNQTKSSIKTVANYIAPFKYTKFDKHLEITRNYQPVKEVFDDVDPKYHKDLESRLKYHLEHARKENRSLKNFGAATDTFDKALVPIDIVADISSFAGIGYALSVGKEILEFPVKLANTIYYTKKTGEYLTPLKDLSYEILSFLVPGSLLDLTNRYSDRVDNYVAKEASRRFVKEFKHYKENKKKPTLDDIGEDTAFQKAA